MCGINGIVSWQRHVRDQVIFMNRHLHHRGPDGNGVHVEEPLALGHVRLSILDLSPAGAQPMQFGRWTLIFNGEIYNFQALQKALCDKGYNFYSRSDTEVLLKAWDCWGDACLTRLEGMFALAIYDSHAKELHLCRDSYGVKPLFYSAIDGEFLFSSELATLVTVQAEPLRLDMDALATFFALHYVPAPQTGLEGLRKLPAGHRMTVSWSGPQLHVGEPVAWHKPFAPQDSETGISLNDLDQALADSVRQQMISDVPVGAFLSGGVDSSLVCHYASRVHPEPLHTFSIGFSDAGSEYDESHFAAMAAKIIGSRHHLVRVELGSLTSHIDDMLVQMGELNADTSVFLNHIICGEARKFVTVGLSGAGGDEMFGGYYRHQALLALSMMNHVPKAVTQLAGRLLDLLPQNRDTRLGNLARRLSRFLDHHGEHGGFLSLVRHDRCCPQSSDFLKQAPMPELIQALAFDFGHFLGDNIFCFTDKMSMLHGLEVRVPFLDPRIVELAEQMNNRQRLTWREKKIALKKLAVRYFPYELIYRRKQGFAAPIDVWLRQLPKRELERRVLDGVATRLVPEEVTVRLIDGFRQEKRDFSLQLYAMSVLNLWSSRILARNLG